MRAARAPLAHDHPSHTLQKPPAASPAVRAALADPAAVAAASRVLAAPPAATERVLDAEVSAAGSLGPLAAAVLDTLSPDEAGLVVRPTAPSGLPPAL